ncbi:MAG: hypothetical protein ACON49_00235 [Candidatus Puniceispirillaceae bacterium]
MKRYLIIIIAILAGLITLALINKLAKEDGSGVKKGHIAGAVVGFVTLFIGLLMLEIGAAPPQSAYVPAKIVDGKVVDPEFITPSDDQQAN